jgi:hypothetical protein
MSRRIPAVLALAASALILLSACGGATASVRTDPKDILTAAVKTAQTAKSVHVEATVDGTLSLDLTGSGTNTPFSLTGTIATADVDIVKQATHATFAVPALLGLSGDLIVVDGKAYLKSTLTGAQYVETDDVTGDLPVDPTKPLDLVSEVNDVLAKPGVDPTKGDDVACGGKQCYTVTIELTPLELASLGATSATATLPINASDATLSLLFRVEKDTDHLAGLTASLASPTQGTLKADIVLSKWDDAVTVAAPPADQIKPAG